MTVQQLQLFDVEVRVDREAGAAIAEGDGLRNWGQRSRLEHQLEVARLRYETHMPTPQIVVFPS
jgi:hypothetical protein